VREWTHTPPSGLSLWELETLWSFEFSESNFKGQNSLDWKFFIPLKFLRLRCLKWVHMIHLNVFNISYGQKKGWESVLIRLLITKSFTGITLKYMHVGGMSHIVGKLLTRVKTLLQTSPQLKVYKKKLWASKMKGILISKTSRFSTWNPRKNDIWM